MITAKPQAISGVSALEDNLVMRIYPSIAATGLGRLLGRVLDSIPLRINGVRLSNLLFGLPLAPLALGIYALQKIAGETYHVTTRAVRVWGMQLAALRMLRADVPLASIARIDIERLPGQAFFHAGDLVLRGADGSELARLSGVPRPDVFRRNIIEARDARVQTEASLATIHARQPA
ncbi:MAG: PH domain-containing protein [Planctomycetaceae bacterium]